MKYISLVLVFCFSFNVLASPIRDLERSLDDYSYALTVEWDQKDKRFYDEKTDEFINQVSRVVKEGGISNAEVLAFAEKKAVSKETVEALKVKFSVLSNLNENEIAEVLKESSKDLYQTGASWNGTAMTIGGIALGVGVAAILGYAIWFGVTHKCVEHDYRRKTDCDSANCYERYCKEFERR